MRILIKHPGQYPELEDINEADALSALQKIVGGYIELVPITHKIRLVVDEEGKLKNYTPNVLLTSGGRAYDVCVGTVAAIGVDPNGDFAELTKEESKYVANWLDVRSIPSNGGEGITDGSKQTNGP